MHQVKYLEFADILIMIRFYSIIVSCFCSVLPLNASNFTSCHKEPKVLGLIIASDQEGSVYPELQKLWKSYMHLDRGHFEMYFIKANPNLSSEFFIDDDTIWIKTEENLSPGILNKTLLAMAQLKDRIGNEFDFVLRTNLSSFYVFPRLLKFLGTLPSKQCYCAVPFEEVIGSTTIQAGSGAGFILSTDLVNLLVEHLDVLLNDGSHPDDVVIGRYLYQQGVTIIPSIRKDFLSLEDWIAYPYFDSSLQRSMMIDYSSENVFHFRIKTTDRLKHDLLIYKNLIKMFYDFDYL